MKLSHNSYLSAPIDLSRFSTRLASATMVVHVRMRIPSMPPTRLFTSAGLAILLLVLATLPFLAAEPSFKDPGPPVVASLKPEPGPPATPFPSLTFHAPPKALPQGAISHDWL